MKFLQHNQSFDLFSLNIDRSRHRDNVIEYLSQNVFDVLCFQEILQPDFFAIKRMLGFYGVFTPRVHWKSIEFDGIARPVTEGIGILSRYPITNHKGGHYAKTKSHRIPHLHHHELNGAQYEGTMRHDTNTLKQNLPRPLLRADLRMGGTTHTILTTHFTWLGNGKVDANTGRFALYDVPLGIEQAREDMRGLLEYLKGHTRFIFTGDLNVARGTELYTKLAVLYQDHIPEPYTSSMDPELFRLGAVPLMIDALMSTPQYSSKHTKLIPGLSDHCAVTSRLEYQQQ